MKRDDKRQREIVKRGGSYYIKLAPVDLIDLGLILGDFVDINPLKKGDGK